MGPEGMRQAGWEGGVLMSVCVCARKEIKRNEWPGLVTPLLANQNPCLSPFAYAEFDGIQ